MLILTRAKIASVVFFNIRVPKLYLTITPRRLQKSPTKGNEIMAKRSAEEPGFEVSPLKDGERPLKPENGDEVGDFEDEFEDEFDSEDEIFEAGVDGRRDEEREAEEKRGTWFTSEALCGFPLSLWSIHLLILPRCYGSGPENVYTGP